MSGGEFGIFFDTAADLLHFVCGLLVPDCFTVFFALGCTWEVYEVVMGLCTNEMAYWAPRW